MTLAKREKVSGEGSGRHTVGVEERACVEFLENSTQAWLSETPYTTSLLDSSGQPCGPRADPESHDG